MLYKTFLIQQLIEKANWKNCEIYSNENERYNSGKNWNLPSNKYTEKKKKLVKQQFWPVFFVGISSEK